MTAPSLATVAWAGGARRAVVKFGGLAVPPTGQTMGWLDLNDADLFRASDVEFDGGYIADTAASLTWRARSEFTSRDFGPRKIHLPVTFDEGNSRGWSWSMAKRFLTQAGDQFLTTDGVTGIRCRFHDLTATKLKVPQPPFLVDTTLEFLSAVPWAEDLAGPVSTGNYTVSGAGGAGAWTTIPISYDAHWFTEPTLSLYLNLTSGHVLNIGFSNVTSGESINWTPMNFTGAHNYYVDSRALTFVVDATEVAPIASGTFPSIYPSVDPANPSLVNNLQVFIQTDGPSVTGTASVTYANRYEF